MCTASPEFELVICCVSYLQESLLEEGGEKAFYGSDDDEDDEEKKAEAAALAKRKPYVMDPDHRLLLRNTKPLLQSRNAAVSTIIMSKNILTLLPNCDVSVSGHHI